MDELACDLSTQDGEVYSYSHVLPHMQDEAAAKMEAALLNGLSL
jgi:hypothetical protein